MAYVSCDYRRLVQILTNLISNAAKSTPEGSEIEVRMTAAIDEIFVCVHDNGIGIEKSLLPTIFELFS